MLELQRLRTLVTVAEEGTVSATAKALYLSPAAVCYQLNQLEKAAGTKLFHRSRHGVALTPAGELLVERARRILAELDDLAVALARLKETKVSRLRLSAPGQVHRGLMPSLIEWLSDEHPHVRVELLTCSDTDPLRAFEEGADIVVAYEYEHAYLTREDLSRYGLCKRDFYQRPMPIALHRDHPAAAQGTVSFTDLATDTWRVTSDDTPIARCARGGVGDGRDPSSPVHLRRPDGRPGVGSRRSLGGAGRPADRGAVPGARGRASPHRSAPGPRLRVLADHPRGAAPRGSHDRPGGQ